MMARFGALTLLAIVLASCDGGSGSDDDVRGLAERVTRAVSSGDQGQLRAIIEFQTERCIVEPMDLGAELCREGEADGTEVEGIWIVGCHGSFRRTGELNLDGAVRSDHEFHGLYAYDGLPGGRYMLVYRPAIAFVTDEKNVISIFHGCTPRSVEELVEAQELGEPIIKGD